MDQYILLCLTKSTAYGDLSPYVLEDEEGRLLENVYQFSKVYEVVPKTRQRASRYDSSIIWDHPYERHVDDFGKLLPSYWSWREKGQNCPQPVRYPVGRSKKHRASCLYSLKEGSSKKLDYISSRKEIYLPLYLSSVRNKKRFLNLKKRLVKGENLLIIEVDGPHEESLDYYKKKYHVNNNFIEGETVLVTQENMKILLNDAKHPFGHGYCLGIALLDIDVL